MTKIKYHKFRRKRTLVCLHSYFRKCWLNIMDNFRDEQKLTRTPGVFNITMKGVWHMCRSFKHACVSICFIN